MAQTDAGAAGQDDVTPMALPPGLMLGPYRVERLVGHGGFGYLYRVTRDGKAYALKISRTRPSDTEDETIRRGDEARLAREVAALKTLDHPNIVRIHSFDRWPTLEDGYPYFIMDLVEGTTLDRWRKRANPSLRHVCELVATVGEALDHIHSHGLFHRDLKPANIMVRGGDGQPVVVDFGIARSIVGPEVTLQGWSIGTIAYFAPEYADWLQSTDVDRREPFHWGPGTDLHALGYVFYELLTCRGPFPFPREGAGETTMHEIIRTVVPTRPSVVTDGAVPDEVDDIVMKLLEKHPEDRFLSGRELAAVLRAVASAGGSEWDAPLPTPAQLAQSASSTRKPVPAQRVGAGPPRVLEDSTADAARLAPVSAANASDSGLLERVAQRVRDVPTPLAAVSAEFRPPTVANERFTGVGRAKTGALREDPSSKEDDRRLLDTAMRKELGRIGSARSRLTAGQRVFVASAGLLLAFFGAVILSKSGADEGERRGSDLLRDAQRSRREELARQNDQVVKADEHVVKPITLTEAAAPESPARSSLASSESLPPVSDTQAERGEPAAGRDVMRSERDRRGDGGAPPHHVERSAGGGRGVGAGGLAKKSRPGEPSWIRKPVQLGGIKVAKKDAMGVPLGAHLRVRLLTNLDSRIPETPVEAMIATPFMLNDEVRIPPRTLLYGTASARGGRFSVSFARMRMPDHSEVEIRGLAIDIGDGKAGLRPGRSIAPEQTAGPSLGARVARSSASSAVSAVNVGTGVGASLLRSAASETVDGVGQDTSIGGGETSIMLDAPVLFEVFVEAAF